MRGTFSHFLSRSLIIGTKITSRPLIKQFAHRGTLHYPLQIRTITMQKLDSKIKLSSNTTSAQIEEGLAQLVRSSQQESGGTGKVSGRWEIIDSGMGLERDFRFKTFKKGWEFMNAIAAECKEHKHHPEWSNVYNRVFIRWTTHSPPGLSEKDVIMARLCDKQAEKHGEIVSEEAVGAKGHEDLGRQLAGRVAAGAGDCCIPKKKGDGG